MYLYICSAGHSGSTLLDLLLGSHSRVASLGEISHVAKNIALNTVCSCGAPVRSCVLWSEVMRRVGSEIGVDVSSNPYELHVGYPLASTVVDESRQTGFYLFMRQVVLGMQFLQLQHELPLPEALTRPVRTAIENRVRVFEAVRQTLDVETIVDSSKSYLDAIGLYKRYPDRVRIVLLTRDGRGVMWSNMKRGLSRNRTVRNWRKRYVRAIPLIKRHVADNHWLQVRYEDLVSETSGVLRKICEMANLEFEDRMIDYRRKTHHILNGNRMRLAGSSDIKVDAEWQDKLLADDLQYFDRHAGTLNRALGYG